MKWVISMNNQILTIRGIDTTKINWFPSTVIEEIIQNVAVLMTTIEGTVPLDRNFGISASIIDEPHPRAMIELSVHIVHAVQEFEPRVQVLEVGFTPIEVEAITSAALDGKLYPEVVVRILDESLKVLGSQLPHA